MLVAFVLCVHMHYRAAEYCGGLTYSGIGVCVKVGWDWLVAFSEGFRTWYRKR